MRSLTYRIPAECDGMTVKVFARSYLGLSSRAFTKQKYLAGGMLRNGAPCRSIDILKAGDVLEFHLPEEQALYPAEQAELSVLWESGDYLVIGKPPGMPIHPSPGHDRDSLLNAVAFYQQTRQEQYLFRPLYRLDKDTSGVVVIGKHRAAVSSAVLEKVYYAVCQGELSGSGKIELPIGLREGSRIRRECGHGEPAVTHWKALASREGHTLLVLRLETGRTHQIRAHLSHLGYPLAGDDLYGGSREKVARQALHCGRVRLVCRALELEKEICQDLPADIREAFPWLPDRNELLKEEVLCQLV